MCRPMSSRKEGQFLARTLALRVLYVGCMCARLPSRGDYLFNGVATQRKVE